MASIPSVAFQPVAADLDPLASLKTWRTRVSAVTAGDDAGIAPGERAAAGRFLFPDDGARFAARRAWVRATLRRHGYDEVNLAARSARHGATGRTVAIGWSSSGNVVLLAACDAPVAVDIEASRARDSLEDLLVRYFSPAERAWIRRLGTAELAFAKAWACKEAVSKLLGLGLRIDPRRIEIEGGPAADRGVRIDGRAAELRCRLLPVLSGHAAAVAVWTGRAGPAWRA